MDIRSSRPNEFRTVSGWLDSSAKPGQVDIYGISGYGGVGKSYLLNQVFDHAKPLTKGFLHINIDGSDSSILGNFMGLYDLKFAPRKVPNSKSDYDYFPHARKLSQQHATIAKEVTDAVKKSAKPDDVKKAAALIFQGGSPESVRFYT